jgi:hypothetical protein
MTPHELLAVFALIGDIIFPAMLGVVAIVAIWIYRNQPQLKAMKKMRKYK